MVSIDALLASIIAWAERRSDVIGLALVGSHARGTAGAGSDVDVVVVVDSVEPYLADEEWPRAFGELETLHDEDHGLVRSRRAMYRGGLEIEWGLADRRWLRIPPDLGTADVLAAGAKVLYDPTGALAALVHAAMARK